MFLALAVLFLGSAKIVKKVEPTPARMIKLIHSKKYREG
jgi:hypothetical protein